MIVTAVNELHVSPALHMVYQQKYNASEFELHPEASEVVVQCVAEPPKPEDNGKHHQWCDEFIEFAGHYSQRHPRGVVLRLCVVDENTREVKKTGKPCHNENDVETLNPKHW